MLAFLEKKKGKKKDAGDRENAQGYYETLAASLPSLFAKRWYRSPAEAKWNEFARVWNGGNCEWTAAHAALEKLDASLQQSE